MLFAMLFLGHIFADIWGKKACVAVVENTNNEFFFADLNLNARSASADGNATGEIGYIFIKEFKSFFFAIKFWLYAVNSVLINANKAFAHGKEWTDTESKRNNTHDDKNYAPYAEVAYCAIG